MTTDDGSKDTPDAAGDPRLQWRDAVVPFSSRFEDTYFSDVDGRAETREVFLGGNGLPDRWDGRTDFVIGELGFGTGLNFLETVSQWRASQNTSGRLKFYSFEGFPMTYSDLLRSLSPWSDLETLARAHLGAWPGQDDVFRIEAEDVLLEVHLGDARQRVALTDFTADAWYLDGFSPAQNPELWDLELLRNVHQRTAPDGTLSTYTAAGWVRRNLQAVGFQVDRVPGFGRKRERLQGVNLAAG